MRGINKILDLFNTVINGHRSGTYGGRVYINNFWKITTWMKLFPNLGLIYLEFFIDFIRKSDLACQEGGDQPE